MNGTLNGIQMTCFGKIVLVRHVALDQKNLAVCGPEAYEFLSEAVDTHVKQAELLKHAVILLTEHPKHCRDDIFAKHVQKFLADFHASGVACK